MKKNIAFALLLIFCFENINAQSYKKIHRQAIVCDTHNDIISTCIEKSYSFDEDLAGKTHSDLTRMQKAGVDLQIFSIWCDGDQKNPYQFANREIDTLFAWANRNPERMKIIYNPAEIPAAIKHKQLICLSGVEGGHMIEDDINKLDSLYKRGVRYMTLTWNNSTVWATSAKDESSFPNQNFITTTDGKTQKKGLNDFGLKVVKHMNDLGMMLDLSHVGEQTFYDAINASAKPILVSHSCVYSLCPVFRNLKDDQIKAVAKNGGVIQLNFFSGFLDSTFMKKRDDFNVKHKAEKDSLMKAGKADFFAEDFLYEKYKEEAEAMRAPFHLLFDHLDYIVKLVGVDYVGLGSDFDGISSPPQQMDDIMSFPFITKVLLQKGYSKGDITKILGSNFLRVYNANAKQ